VLFSGPVPHLPHREKEELRTGKTGFGIEGKSKKVAVVWQRSLLYCRKRPA
jgi:hypothetical protein